MCFEWPENIGFLMLLIPLAVVLGYGVIRQMNVREEVISEVLADSMMPFVSFRVLVVKRIMLFFAIGLALFALTGPRLCNGNKPVLRKGVDIVFMLDVSRSMTARDVLPDRLSQAKFEISRISHDVRGGRRSIILFAAEPLVQCPLTSDREAFDALLGMASPELIEQQGTVFRTAFEMAGSLLEPATEKKFAGHTKGEKIVVLLSDGEDHSGGFITEAERLKKKGVRFFVAGVGTTSPAVIPAGPGADIKKDENGRPVTTSFNPESLRSIAASTGGTYYRSTSEHQVNHDIAAAINRIAATSQWVMEPSDTRPLDRYVLAAAFLLLFAETLTGRGWRAKR